PIFNLPLIDNIMLGKTIPDDLLQTVLDGVEVSSFIQNISTTNIGEIETNLSAGQQQRIRIARGLLQDADIYLFDEAFNGIDTTTKEKVLSFISKFLKDKTVLFITHNENELGKIQIAREYEFKNH